MDHRGSYETTSETCSKIKKYIELNGMKVCGNAYTMDLLNYISEKNPDSYVIRISVEVSG